MVKALLVVCHEKGHVPPVKDHVFILERAEAPLRLL
jgi:hypothetical protein